MLFLGLKPKSSDLFQGYTKDHTSALRTNVLVSLPDVAVVPEPLMQALS
jgi:hypothetical protein